MRRHPWVRLLPLVLLGVLLMAPVAHAKPCVPEFELQKADLVVLGEVVWKPFPYVKLVRAERYYRGVGKRYFFAMNTGTFAWSNWQYQRKNTLQVMSFGQGSGAITHGTCSLFRPPDESVAPLKPGVAPEPGVDLRLWLFWVDLALTVGMLLLIVRKVRRWLEDRRLRTL